MNKVTARIMVLLALVLPILAVTSFAISNPYYTLPIKPNEPPYDGGLLIGTWTHPVSGGPYNLYAYNTSSTPSDIVFAGSYQTRASIEPTFVSLSPSQSCTCYYYMNGSWQTRLAMNLINTYDYNGTTLYWYRIGVDLDYYDITLGDVFYDLDDQMAYAASLLDYIPPPDTHTYTFNIPAGYAAYIQYNASMDVSLKATMPELSTPWLAGSQPDFWPGMYASFNVSVNVPSLNATVNYDNFTRIEWDRGTDRNTLGQTKTAVQTIRATYYDNVPYLVIYNPPYYYESNNYGNEVLSPTITVTTGQILSVKLVEVTGNTVTYIGDVSTDGIVTDPSTGDIVNPTPGGGNYIPEDNNLATTLSGLINDIDSFFRGTWQYVRQLVQSIGTFPEIIQDIYNWMPPTFRAMVFSLFTICCIVAVLKVML